MAGYLSSSWSIEQDKLFEMALVLYEKDTPDRWHKIARVVGGKSPEEVRMYYDRLVQDLILIESGQTPIPNYTKNPPTNTIGITEVQRSVQNFKIQ